MVAKRPSPRWTSRNEDELSEDVLVLEEEEALVPLLEKVEVDDVRDGRLAEIVSVVVEVLGTPDLGDHYVQPAVELDRGER